MSVWELGAGGGASSSPTPFSKAEPGTMSFVEKRQRWFFLKEVAEDKRNTKKRQYLVTQSFEVEILGRGAYTYCQEVDLEAIDPRYLIEDYDEESNCSEG